MDADAGECNAATGTDAAAAAAGAATAATLPSPVTTAATDSPSSPSRKRKASAAAACASAAADVISEKDRTPKKARSLHAAAPGAATSLTGVSGSPERLSLPPVSPAPCTPPPRRVLSSGSAASAHTTPVNGPLLPPDESVPVTLRASRLTPRKQALEEMDDMLQDSPPRRKGVRECPLSEQLAQRHMARRADLPASGRDSNGIPSHASPLTARATSNGTATHTNGKADVTAAAAAAAAPRIAVEVPDAAAAAAAAPSASASAAAAAVSLLTPPAARRVRLFGSPSSTASGSRSASGARTPTAAAADAQERSPAAVTAAAAASPSAAAATHTRAVRTSPRRQPASKQLF